MNLDDLLKSIREEDDDSKGGKDLDDLLKSIRSEEETPRKTLENKLGKDVISKLSDDQIKKLSEYYNSLPPKEREKTDKEIAKKRGEFFDIARGMAGIKFVELNENEKQKFTPNAVGVEQGPILPPKEEGGDVYSERKKFNSTKFLKRKTFENPLKGQRFTAPEIIQTRSTTSKVKADKIIPKDGVIGEEIAEKLDELIKVIRKDNKLEEKIQKFESREKQREKRKNSENRIENKKQTKLFSIDLKKGTGKISNFFDDLMRFLTFSVLGGLVTGLYNFIMNPENDEKIEATQKFLRNNWKILLGAAAYFLTPLGGLVNFLVKTVGGFAIRLGALMIKHPLLAAALGGAALGIGLSEVAKKRQEESRERQRDFQRELGVSFEGDKEFDSTPFIDTPDNPVEIRQREVGFFEKLRNTRDNLIFGTDFSPDQVFFGGGGTTGKPVSGEALGFSRGGFNMGTDTVPALLTPGEVVMNKPTVNAIGAENLLAANRKFGGTNANRPKVGKVMGYQGGGFVISPEERRMLDAISGAEGTKGYGTLYGGRNIPELAKGEMTINQVLNMQETGSYKGKSVYAKDRYDSDATGRYQFMSYTLKEEANRAGYDLNKTKFTPQLQDELILRRIRRMRKVTPEMLKSEGMSDRVIDMLAPEFASFPNLFGPDSKGRYGTNSSFYGQGGKSAEYIRGLYNKSDGKDEMLPSIANVPTMSGSLGPAFDSDSNIKRQQTINNSFNNAKQKLSNPLESFVFTPLRRALSVATPNIPTETRNFMMPPVETSKQNQSSNQTGDIPSFNISSGNSMRDLVSKDLGIHDLVGTSS